MRVQVLYFGPVREIVGKRAEDVEIEPGSTVASLRERIVGSHPKLADRIAQVRWAVDGEYVRDGAPLVEGAEVALIPPVAGGAPEPFPIRTEIVESPIAIDDLRDWAGGPHLGAVTQFLGVVRDHHDGRSVVRLEYECYGAMARRQLARIAAEAREQFDVERVGIVHRIGSLAIGDVSLAVVISGVHRAATFEAAPWVVSEIKRDVPIWKHEFYADGSSVWVSCEAHASS